MALSTDPTDYVNAASGFLIAAIALWVGVKGRFRGRYLGFALAEGGFGAATGFANLLIVLQVTMPPATESAVAYALAEALRTVLYLAAVGGLAVLLRTHPAPESKGFPFSWRWAWPLATCIGILLIVQVPILYGRWLAFEPRRWLIDTLGNIGFDLLLAAQVGVLAALGLAYARIAPSKPHARREVVLFAVAIAIYPVARFGTLWHAYSGPAPPSLAASAWIYYQGALLTLLSATLALALGSWLYASRRTPGTAPRNMVLFIAALFAIGVTLRYLAPGFQALPGISRIAMFLVFLYAIARHQYLGIDVRARWAVNKSTIAATFIAVFFIASEAAQQFFGDALGSQYVGIIAAGALVFAIAPLSRFADRLAQRAVPKETDGQAFASNAQVAAARNDAACLAALRAAHRLS